MRYLLPTTSLNLHPTRFETFAAIGTGLATTAVSVGGSLLASNLSSGGSSQSAGAGYSGELPTYTTTFEPIEFSPISNVNYNAPQGSRDLLQMFPALAQFAQKATAFQTRQRERIMPGAKQRFAQGSEVLSSWLQGQVPQDVMDFTNRAVAERTGGTFNPATGGGRAPQDFARSIGKLSSDFTQLGVSAAPAWLQLADSFVVKPLDVADRAIAMNEIRYQYDALNTDINRFNAASQLETDMFNATSGEAGSLSEFRSQRDLALSQQAAQAANQARGDNFAAMLTGLAGTGIEAGLQFAGNNVASQANPTYVGNDGNMPIFRPSEVRLPGAKNFTPATPANYR